MSRHSYLFIYDDAVGTREQVKGYLDTRSEITHWRYDLPNTFYLISERSAAELYEIIQSFNQKRGRFLICEARQNKQGWLPKETWTLLNEKRYLRKEGVKPSPRTRK